MSAFTHLPWHYHMHNYHVILSNFRISCFPHCTLGVAVTYLFRDSFFYLAPLMPRLDLWSKFPQPSFFAKWLHNMVQRGLRANWVRVLLNQKVALSICLYSFKPLEWTEPLPPLGLFCSCSCRFQECLRMLGSPGFNASVQIRCGVLKVRVKFVC